ncbi:6-bladed beta-propeller [uncultured Parabacteroides sp.]|uniref:6-bladed beta-propeller n=1 Tax=uncultured Parabacteroides sp. TaxID=512312 RepID=UPI00265B459E|nr:6-bladed beta-propeller [uncultured Parabacteroides sp.]
MKINYLFFVFVICCSCNKPKQAYKVEGAISGAADSDSFVCYPIQDDRIIVNLDNDQKVSLFDYFSHIELIPLETNDDILIGYCEDLVPFQNRYYIFDRKRAVVQIFDQDGKFISLIDKRGQGPGEYTPNLTSIFLNPFTGNIDITDMGCIYSYDLTGKHVRTIPRSKDASGFYWNLIALSDNLYVCHILMLNNLDTHKINYYDVKENKIIHKEYKEDEFLNNYAFVPSVPPFYEYNGKYYFYRLVDNATYEVGLDSLKRAYIWDFGKYNYDAKKLNLPDEPSSMSTLSYRIDIQGQNNRYVMAYIYLRDGVRAYLIHDKSIDECKYIKHFTESVGFIPRKITNEYVLTWYEHGELENYITEDMLDENNRKKYHELLDAREEMNPIIVKYYFK